MQTCTDTIVQSLSSVGCDKAFGVSGGSIYHIWKALHQSDIAVYHCRHESGAAFAAAEYSLQTGKVAALFATSGPGITNSITGLLCARSEGARVVFIAALTGEENYLTGRRVAQETIPRDVEALKGPAINSALSDLVIIRSHSGIAPLQQSLTRIQHDPLGGVLGVFLTPAKSHSLISPTQRPRADERRPVPYLSTKTLFEVIGKLKTKSIVLWIGYGCRNASLLVRKLAERHGVHVLATPRAKDIFPETHPLYLGTTGFGASISPETRQTRPKAALLLGSNAAEQSSFFIQQEWLYTDFYCVGLNLPEVKRNMPGHSTLIEAEISHFLRAVMDVDGFEDRTAYRYPPTPDATIQAVPAASNGMIHPVTVMSVIQDVVINLNECPIIADAGNSLFWIAYYLKFPKPGFLPHGSCCLRCSRHGPYGQTRTGHYR
ncbi:hypothetical protein FGADI_8390 [Fusarium gaditjirri]|uniref:Pyruvate decarboxylase n=1 Tax=Fusarium gaditjirri TaxID=282569 RepID=A0A8H4T2J8_9HYPO|nr:hypothetical protein FGADI_8390 [Fusarium gaditjirri]